MLYQHGKVAETATKDRGPRTKQHPPCNLPMVIGFADLALGCGFFDAGSVIEVSPLDGVHFGVDAHATLGQALAQAVLDRLR